MCASGESADVKGDGRREVAARNESGGGGVEERNTDGKADPTHPRAAGGRTAVNGGTVQASPPSKRLPANLATYG